MFASPVGVVHESAILVDVTAVVVIGIGGWGVIDGVAVESGVCAEYNRLGPFMFTACT